MAQYIIGGIMLVLGALLAILVPMKIKNKNIEIRFMQTTAVKELKEILEGNAAAGLEGYRHYVELKGQAGSEKPVKTPFSEKEVAYYDASLYQVTEERQTTTDKTKTTQTIKKNETLMTNDKSSQPVSLKDTSGLQEVTIDISQAGSALEALKTFDRFEPSNNLSKYSFFTGNRYGSPGAGTLGFRMTEKTIPLGQNLYVLGEARLENNRIFLGKPMDKRKPFIVSARDKSDIVSANKSGANAALVFGILIAVAGILLMIFMR
jgi:hypothetical protein